MTQTNPEQWAVDVRYLAKLADWAAGEGFCQLKDMDDPDEWCFAKWNELKPESNGDDYSADALAVALIASIQAAFAEREARNRTDATPACWLYRNSEGHTCVQFVQGLMDLNHWTETPLYPDPPATDVAALVEAAKAMAEDHMTSEHHHPGYVLVPTVAFEQLRQALAPFTKGQNDE